MARTKKKPKTALGKAWRFIWEDNSPLSWLVNVVLAFVLIKFLVYPGLGLALGTSHPVVAVISGSMEHDTHSVDEWWADNAADYEQYNITRETFGTYPMKNGFNRGDIIVLRDGRPQNIKVGEIIVFTGGHPEPIIHRVVARWEENGTQFFRTKGDNNKGLVADEMRISEERIIGRAWMRLPLLGYVKIGFGALVGQLAR